MASALYRRFQLLVRDIFYLSILCIYKLVVCTADLDPNERRFLYFVDTL